jgi:hypothetical protein
LIITFQEFEKHESDRAKWIGQAIAQYMRSDEYKEALEADLYEKQQNTGIKEVERLLYTMDGKSVKDFTKQNHQIPSNFFHRLVTQRVSYSLGNGVFFASRKKEIKKDKSTVMRDATKEALGNDFDDILYRTGYNAVKHGKCYCFFNDGEYHVFPMTEFLAFKDELSGKIRAGARFWCLEWRKRPVVVDLYEEDGYSRYVTAEGKYGLGALVLDKDKKPYKETVSFTEADGEEVVGGENYDVDGEATIPIAIMYGNKNKQSALVGMKANIDAYDMIQSGYANDLSECAQVYWIISNAQGMDEGDLTRFRDRLLLQHIAVADTEQSAVTPYTQEIPFNSREACLNRIRDCIYSDFGALDVKNISPSNSMTATEIRAAYQAMDEEADDFEYQVNEFVQQILDLVGIEDYPQFDRNRISNEKEETEMIMLAANYLDPETILRKLPFISVDEVDDILFKLEDESVDRFKDELNDEAETPEEV